MLKIEDISARGYKFNVTDEAGHEVGRAFLYVMHNALHEAPFGFLEDVYIDEASRGHGYGKALITEVLAKAKEVGCYKLVATSRMSRDKVHDFYLKLGFQDYGKEFRLDF